MNSGRDRLALGGLALIVAAVTAIGIGVRATQGAQTTADEPQYLLSALSLWEDADLDISDELADERYRDFHEADLPQQTLLLEDGRRISPHDPLLPLLLAAPMGIGGWVAAKLAMAAMGGALAALLAWTMVTRLHVSRTTAFVTAGIAALGPPLAVYSTQVYPEIPAAIALLAGFAAVLGPFETRGRLALVIAVIALPWLAVKFVPVAAVLAAAGLVRAGNGRRAPILTVLVTVGVVYLIGHLLIYGGVTAYAAGDHFVGGEFTAVGSKVSLWGRSTRLLGLLVDRGFGIGAWQPAYLILPFIFGWAASRRGPGLTTATWLLGMGWVVATFVALTMHGWWFPGRQLVVVLPIVAVIAAAWLDGARSWQRNLVFAGGLLGVVAFIFLLVDGLREELTWVVDFGTTTNPFYQSLASGMPNYVELTTTTLLLHGVWTVVALSLLWMGWRAGRVQAATKRRSAANSPTPTLLPPTETV